MEPIIIGIAGGSGSGKSTFTNRLRQYFGDDVVVIYHDNYYRRQDGIPFEQRVKVNYDHPDSLETDLLVEHLKELKAGKTIECPVYDYSQHNRSSEIIKIEPRPIILVEGILLLADERIRSLLDIKVYVEADADERIRSLLDIKVYVEADADERIRSLLDIKVYVEADADERILRRIVRDVEERGRDLKGIITQYLTTVKPMHYMYVEPTRALADIVINSGKNDVAFDLFVSKIGQLLESAGNKI
ncbi:uridine-cytidine kinase [Clostridiaceae bacterium AF02-42]|nr:uridine-cytidine kinase [Clostridiaceae bacterium AF02-42]